MKSIVRLIPLMLCESKIVVRGSDVNLVSIVTAALPRLSPLTWECVHIPLKPLSLTTSDLIDCPTPFIVGVVPTSLPSSSSDTTTVTQGNSVQSLLHRYHPLTELGVDSDTKSNSNFPCDVSLLDLDCDHLNMLTEALDYKDTLNCEACMLSNQLCNDILTALKGKATSNNDDDEEEEDDDEEDGFMDGFYHSKQFLEQQSSEVNESCKRSFGPLIPRTVFKSHKDKLQQVDNTSKILMKKSNDVMSRLNSEIANQYSYGLNGEEMEVICDVRDVLNKFIASLCEDVGSNWNNYGEVHPQQGFIICYIYFCPSFLNILSLVNPFYVTSLS